jgi:prophage antirepressor-like protein
LLTAIQLRPTIFNFGDNTVRVIEGSEGEPWFVAADVCRCLGLKIMPNGSPNTTDALRKLMPDEVGLDQIETNAANGRTRRQQTKFVSESGLYKLVMRSDKPEAREFQNWVTREVLPAIRKDGA